LESFNKAEKVKKLPPDELFNDVYAEIPEALKVIFNKFKFFNFNI